MAKQNAKNWFVLAKSLIENESLIIALIQTSVKIDDNSYIHKQQKQWGNKYSERDISKPPYPM